VIAGYHQDGPRSVDVQSWNWRGIDVINAHERDPAVYLEGIRLAAQWTVEERLDPDPLYTHRFPLERVADALDAACERPDGFMKALVMA
jgi:threonine dehydrogenase-like Zn-dependent dehydrogenase